MKYYDKPFTPVTKLVFRIFDKCEKLNNTYHAAAITIGLIVYIVFSPLTLILAVLLMQEYTIHTLIFSVFSIAFWVGVGIEKTIMAIKYR